MVTSDRAVVSSRPESVRWAVMLNIVSIVAGLLAFVVPGADDIPGAVIAIAIALNVLTLACLRGLWNLRRWGAIGAFVLTALNTFAALPGLIEPPSGWVLAVLLVLIATGIASLVMIAHRSSRAAYS